MMVRLISVLPALLACSIIVVPPVCAQMGAHFGGADESRTIVVRVKLSQEGVHDDSSVYAMLLVDIQKGWHINSATPSDENLIATSLQVSAPLGIDAGNIRYPVGFRRTFSFSSTPLDVYEGTVRIVLRLHVGAAVKPDLYSLPADFTYQACNDNTCLAPSTVRVMIPVHVVPADVRVVPLDRELFDGIIGEQ